MSITSTLLQYQYNEYCNMLTISSRNLNLASRNVVSFGGWQAFITSQNELMGTSTFVREWKNNSQSITFNTYNHKICKQIFTVDLLECISMENSFPVQWTVSAGCFLSYLLLCRLHILVPYVCNIIVFFLLRRHKSVLYE